MRKLKVTLVVAIFLTVGISFSKDIFVRGKTMSSSEVKRKWGAQDLNISKFKGSLPEVKATMAYSLMVSKNLLGKTVPEVREMLGSPDGFYFIDSYPAYIIQDGKSPSEDTWQVVFRLNSDRKVRDIIVHRNCCER